MAAPFRVRAIAATCLVAVGATTLHGNTSSASCCLCPVSGKKGTNLEEEKVHITDTYAYMCSTGCVRFDKSCLKGEACDKCDHGALARAIQRQMAKEGASPCQKVGKCDILAETPGAELEKFLLDKPLDDGTATVEPNDNTPEILPVAEVKGKVKGKVQEALSSGLKHPDKRTYYEAYGQGVTQWAVLVRSLSPLLFRDAWKTYLDTHVAAVADKCAEADDVRDFWKEITKKAKEAWDGADEGCAPELGLTRPNKLALWERDFTNDGKDQQPWLAEMQKLGVVVQEEEIKEETPEEKKEREEKAKAQRAEKSARAQEWANKQNDKAKELENKNAEEQAEAALRAQEEEKKKQMKMGHKNKMERRKEATKDLTGKKDKKHHGCSIIRSLVKKIAAIAARH